MLEEDLNDFPIFAAMAGTRRTVDPREWVDANVDDEWAMILATRNAGQFEALFAGL